jgi:hypothetical protein
LRFDDYVGQARQQRPICPGRRRRHFERVSAPVVFITANELDAFAPRVVDINVE